LVREKGNFAGVAPYLVKLWQNQVTATFRSVLDRRIINTASALYGAQFVNYILPMVMIPYLARVLGPDAWGIVVFVQAIGMYLLLVVDYSFELSATRAIARHRDDAEKLAQIVSGVFGARLSLVAGCVAAVAMAQAFTPTLRGLGWLLWLGVFWFTVAALRPFWFYLGLERVRAVLAIEVSMKCLSVAGVLLVVNSPADAWRVFAVQGAAAAVSTLAATVMVYRLVAFRRPSVSGAMDSLKQGWNLFVFRASTSVYGMSGVVILGFLASPVAVAYYGAAERIIRVLFGMMSPITQAMFPRASTLIKDDPNSAARFARVSTLTLFSLTATGSILLYFLGPHIVRIVLGPDYGEAVPVFRIMLLVLLLNGISIPLSNHWMIPSGLERLLTKVTIAGGILHIPVAITLGSQFAHLGMAWALVVTEAFILTVLTTVLLTRGLGPFRMNVHRDRVEAEKA
jgi:polysaccharide transporter, PST family